mgnify:CR=1 FL=1
MTTVAAVQLPEPVASHPVLYGAPTADTDLLPWSWALERLTGARNYWVATVRPSGRPHSRPVWGVWLADGFWFTTASLARHNVATNPEVTVHLEDGDASVIIEGRCHPAAGAGDVLRMAEPYNAKYGWTLRPDGDAGNVADANEPIGPALRVEPEVVFGWEATMRNPTRWRF